MINMCTIILGPMFSGKTTTLCVCLSRDADVNKRVAYVNHSSDVRSVQRSYGSVTTHHSAKMAMSHKVHQMKLNDLSSLDFMQYSVIGIDEGQFFSKRDMEIVKKWVLNGRKVYVSTLSGDFKMDTFGHVFDLLPICDKIMHLGAYCHFCLKKGIDRMANFTMKIGGSGNQTEIGGEDLYRPVCLECHPLYINGRGSRETDVPGSDDGSKNVRVHSEVYHTLSQVGANEYQVE